MPETFALSESAVAVLRFRVKGYRMKVTDRSLETFRELAAAGIMEPVPGADGNPDRIIGGADGVFDRGMQWQGTSLWMTLRYGPDPWVPSSFLPTLGGRLFHHKDLAGPLVPELN